MFSRYLYEEIVRISRFYILKTNGQMNLGRHTCVRLAGGPRHGPQCGCQSRASLATQHDRFDRETTLRDTIGNVERLIPLSETT